MIHAATLELDVDKARALLDDVYAQIRETGEAVSAERIWNACEYLSKLNVRRITATAVGERCTQDFGGPRAQSIRNKPKTLGELVRRWDEYHALKLGRTSGSRRYSPSKVVVEDPTAVAYIRLLERQVDDLTKKVQRLSEAFRHLEPLQITRASESDRDDKRRSGSYVSHALSATEVASIVRFLNPEHLITFDLSMDNRTRIKQGSRVLMERPVVDLLKKLAAGTKSEELE